MSRPFAGAAASLLLLACSAIGMQPALVQIHQSWTSVYGHFSHGYLVLAMACACLYLTLHREGWGQPAPQWRVLPLVLGLALALFVSLQLGITAISQSLVPLLLLAAIVAVFGGQVGRRFLFPAALLLTAMPLWWVINAPLQWLTAGVANLAVKASGIPAFVEGNQFHLPAGVVEVASGCSGLNYFVTALSLSVFQAACFLARPAHRIRLVLVAVAMALLCNWVRVYSLVVVGYLTDMRHYLITVDHLTYGWVLFLVFMFPVFVYGARLARSEGEGAMAPLPRPVARGAGQALLPAAMAVVVVLLLPRLLSMALTENTRGLAELDGAGGGSYADLPVAVPGARERRATLHVSGVPVWAYEAIAGKADRDVDMPATVRDVLARDYVLDSPSVTSTFGGTAYQEFEGTLYGRHVLLRSGFFVVGQPVVSAWQVKLAALKGLLALRAGEVLWVVATPCDMDCSAARLRLDSTTMEVR